MSSRRMLSVGVVISLALFLLVVGLAPPAGATETSSCADFQNSNGSWVACISSLDVDQTHFKIMGGGENEGASWTGHIEVHNTDGCGAPCVHNTADGSHSADAWVELDLTLLISQYGCTHWETRVWKKNADGTYTNEVAVTGLMFC